uniref:Uncharacterized protein n=1 Tax=Siphoviridae sp. ctedO8 TaxID=2827907 RepID=A0A8S5T3J2_9CAUD|nr:MAG TPA: hypothetical protein [Siphoviridae sp. ctedO8]
MCKYVSIFTPKAYWTVGIASHLQIVLLSPTLTETSGLFVSVRSTTGGIL